MTPGSAGRILLNFLGLGIGALLAVALLGTRTTEQTQLASNADRFRQLSSEDQHLVRLSFRDYLAQSTERQQTLHDIQNLSQSSPDAQAALNRFGKWWKDLSRADWDAWAATSGDDRLQFVKDRWTSDANARDTAVIEIRFPAAYERFLPRLLLTHAELEAIVFALVPEDERPAEINQNLEQLPDDRRRSLSLILWMFRQLAEQGEQPQRNEVVARKMKHMKQLLLEKIQDDDWTQKFRTTLQNIEGRSIEVYWLTPVVYAVLGQAAVQLGRELLHESTVTEEAVLAEFDRITPIQQRELMQLPPAQARARLQYLAQIQAAQGSQRQLLQHFEEFTRNFEQLMRTATFGFGSGRRTQDGRSGDR